MRKIIVLFMLCSLSVFGADFTNSIGMTFKEIPAGNGIKSFYMAEAEVTQEQWLAIMGNNPSAFQNWDLDLPVDSISLADALEFVKRLNAKEQTQAYRLPTHDESNYVRFEGKSDFPCKDPKANPAYPSMMFFADCLSNSIVYGKKGPKPVKSKQPNKWGIYDTFGNVMEISYTCKGQQCTTVYNNGNNWLAFSPWDLFFSPDETPPMTAEDYLIEMGKKPQGNNYRKDVYVNVGVRLAKNK